MTIDDVNGYLLRNNISITPTEVNIIYNFIKRNCNLVLNGNEECFYDLKKSLSLETYNKAMELYERYKESIQKLN